MVRFLNLLANLFPFWVLLGSGLALLQPTWFTWFSGPFIVWGLAAIMIGMGLTLTFDDFRRVARLPRVVFLGVLAQFLIMPFLGWAIAHGLQLETQFAVGLILVACCPGGTASNVVSYVARADVALSVLLTMCSTFAAVLLTPLLTKWLAGAYVPVDGWSLFLKTVQVVLLPVAAGVFLNHFFPRLVKAVNPVSPLVSVLFIALICASIIGSNADAVKASAGVLLAAVALLHLGGFALGYTFGVLAGCSPQARRTLSIEVGMQNSGLGAVLARQSFPALPLAAVPAALSATLHSLIGSVLAGIWRARPANPPVPPEGLLEALEHSEGPPA